MAKKDIRLLRADEIECRIGMVSEKGLSLLLFKDARADMKILDEVYGTAGWQRRHEVIGGNLYCTVSIWDDAKKQWIEKQDVGTESYTEKEKGQASDSFKRACVSLGIGRELCTAPFIWVGASKTRMEQKGNKWVCHDKFTVTEIIYNDNREIIGLTIINQDGREVYRLWNKSGTQISTVRQADTGSEIVSDLHTKPQRAESSNASYANSQKKESVIAEERQAPDKVRTINRELERTGIALDMVLSRYGVSSIESMDDDTYRRALSSLKRTKGRAA